MQRIDKNKPPLCKRIFRPVQRMDKEKTLFAFARGLSDCLASEARIRIDNNRVAN